MPRRRQISASTELFLARGRSFGWPIAAARASIPPDAHRYSKLDCVPLLNRRLSGSRRVFTLGEGSTLAHLFGQALDDRAFGPTVAVAGLRELQQRALHRFQKLCLLSQLGGTRLCECLYIGARSFPIGP